jgi:hypothetical protein
MLRHHHRVAHEAALAQRAGGPRLVEAHEPAVAGHVGGQYRSQPAFDPTGCVPILVSSMPWNMARRELI